MYRVRFPENEPQHVSRPIRSRLSDNLVGQDEAPSYRTIARELGLTEGAVRSAAHRLRARYRERLREEIARTVADPADVDDEIKSLLNSLSR
jgi:predicted transcriptional regulator